MTNGGETGTNGSNQANWSRAAWMTAGIFVAVGMAQVVVNVSSLIDERRALGHAIAAWRVWVWEISSLVAWLALVPVILYGANWARRRLRRIALLAFHLLGAALMSLAHSAIIVGLRMLAFWTVGDHYAVPGAWTNFLRYELRKDLITYALIVLTFHLLIRLATASTASQTGAALPATIEIRDGNRSVWVKIDDILWVSAAGNYVELQGADNKWMVRRTLNEIAAALGPYGFVQVHRSRLVKRSEIAALETRQSGDFDVTLRGGCTVGGSRRYRNNL